MLKVLFLFIFSLYSYGQGKLVQNIKYGYSKGLRYSLVPLLKEHIYLSKGNIGSVEKYLQKIILTVGARNFEGLDTSLLLRGSTTSMRYLAAKKVFGEGDYDKAKSLFSRIRSTSTFYPFAQNFLAVISYLKKEYSSSLNHYQSCLDSSASRLDDSLSTRVFKQIKVNRDICIAGIPRVHYAQKNYKKADYTYLDLDKRSIAWPPILLEEAWSSYYRKHYNRTLGKLVTYKAPQLRFVSNPEIYLLRATTYLRMCLYGDVSKVVEDFYNRYEKTAQKSEQLIKQEQSNPDYYYQLVKNYQNESDEEFQYALKGVYKSPNVKSFFDNIRFAEAERKKIRKVKSGKLQSLLNNNIDEFVKIQKKVIGLVAQSKLEKHGLDLRKSFQAMSYIKLEVLGRKKEALYEGKEFSTKRGDIKYLKRNDRQYFWSFNKEFWSDELGDYVFALPVECPNEK